VGEPVEKPPHPASVARFVRKGTRWANRRYAVASFTAWVLASGSLAVGLAGTHNDGVARWIVFAVFAVLSASSGC
jgi:hypothetical protein